MLIDAFADEGHHPISTDFSEQTVSALRERGFPESFAVDLTHIDRVLKSSFDYAVGNSVLGYIEPKRIHEILKKVVETFSRGALFTFDLAPHGSYFLIADNVTKQTVANESNLPPDALLQFIDEYGVRDGINAWAHFNWTRTHATNLSVVWAIADVLREARFFVNVGSAKYSDDGGAITTVLTLRVSKDSTASILKTSAAEKPIASPLVELLASERKVYSPLLFIDRDAGVRLAKKLGLRVDAKQSAWDVADYVQDLQDASAVTDEIVAANITRLDIDGRIRRIKATIFSASEWSFEPIDKMLAMDQTIHKLTLKGEADMTREQADALIDHRYEMAAASKQQRDANADRKRRRKEQRRKRKSNR